MLDKLKTTVIFLFFINVLFGQIYETDKGQFEFVGLEEWKFENLIDSIKSFSKPNSFHPCGAELTGKLNFAEATVMMSFTEEKKLYTVVKLIEDSSKIKYSQEPEFEMKTCANFKQMESILNENRHIINPTLFSYRYNKLGEKERAEEIIKNWSVDSIAVHKIWNFIEHQNSQEDYDIAIWILKNDKNEINIKCAMLTLINFTEFDLSWWLIFEKLRYPSQNISRTAQNILNLFTEQYSRRINWEPAINSIKYTLNGTYLWGYDEAVKILTKTEIDPKLIIDILPEINDLLLTHLSIQYKQAKQNQIEFLRYINNDLNTEDEFIEWLKKI